MKHTLAFAAACLGAALSSQAVSFSVDFDGVPSGTLANAVAPAGLTFEPAVYLPDYDDFGDPIPGTDKWRVDITAPPLTIEYPMDYGRGPAPSPEGALNALFQPTLLLFNVGDTIEFSVALDNDPFGDPALDLLFLDVAGNIIHSLTTDQTVPGFTVNYSATFAQVSQIVLPAGAFYDNLQLTVVPEGSTVLSGVGASFLALAGWLVRRRRA